MVTKALVIRETDCELEGGDATPHGAVRWRTLLGGERSATEGLTLGVADVSPGGPAPRPHRHAHAEAYYTLSGQGVVRIDDAEHALAPGTTVFIPGGAIHHAWNTGTEPLRILYVFPADSFSQIEYEFPDP